MPTVNDLPSRDAWKAHPNSPTVGFAIADAYACSDLMTRVEFVDSLDMEAARQSIMDAWLIDDSATAALMALIEGAINAALEDDTV